MGLAVTGRLLLLAALLWAPAWQATAQSEERAWLGVYIGNLADAPGAFVAHVEPHGPAAAAAIFARDMIVAVNGRTVRNTRELSCLLERRKPGDTVEIAVLRRGGIRRAVTVKLGQWPDRVPPARGDCGDAISRRVREPAQPAAAGARGRPKVASVARPISVSEAMARNGLS